MTDYVATDADLDAIAAEHATRSDLLALRTDALNRTIARAERAEKERDEALAKVARTEALLPRDPRRRFVTTRSLRAALADTQQDAPTATPAHARLIVRLAREMERTEAAETELAALKARIEALADSTSMVYAADLRALLVPVDDPTPATDAPDTTTEQEAHGLISMLTCECCGQGCDCGCVEDCPAPSCREVARRG